MISKECRLLKKQANKQKKTASRERLAGISVTLSWEQWGATRAESEMKRYALQKEYGPGWEEETVGSDTRQEDQPEPTAVTQGTHDGDVNKVTGIWDRKENTHLGEMEEAESLWEHRVTGWKWSVNRQ